MRLELVNIRSDSIIMEGMLELPDEPTGMVLFAHGTGSSRFSPNNKTIAAALHEADVGTLLLDLLTTHEDRDFGMQFNVDILTQRLAGAATWLTLHESTRKLPLGLFGSGSGAAAALQFAARGESKIAAIVARGGRPDLTGSSVLATVSVPTLLIVGELDETIATLNRAAYEALRCEKQLTLIHGATHRFEEPGTLAEVASLSVSWFTQHFPLRN